MSYTRRGFTLIELLVVILVIATLVALILPAIQASREAARKSQCSNNLKQIGLAVNFYVNSNGSFPLGSMFSGDPRYTKPGNAYCYNKLLDRGFLISILPGLEQSAVFDSINYSLLLFSLENRTVLSHSVSTYLCPSDYKAGSLVDGSLNEYFPQFIGTKFNTCSISTASYAAIHGDNASFALPELSGRNCVVPAQKLSWITGTIVEIPHIGYSSVFDGLSHTAIVSEKAISLFQQFDNLVPKASAQIGWWTAGTFLDTLIANNYPPNSYKSVKLIHEALFPPWFASASSLHPGGVNVLFADGSVHFVKETISSWSVTSDLTPPGVWQAISTRNGSEIINSGDF